MWDTQSGVPEYGLPQHAPLYCSFSCQFFHIVYTARLSRARCQLFSWRTPQHSRFLRQKIYTSSLKIMAVILIKGRFIQFYSLQVRSLVTGPFQSLWYLILCILRLALDLNDLIHIWQTRLGPSIWFASMWSLIFPSLADVLPHCLQTHMGLPVTSSILLSR